MTIDHGERIATLEADLAHIKQTIAIMQAENVAQSASATAWLRSIGVGILLLFMTSSLNFFVWLLNKIGV